MSGVIDKISSKLRDVVIYDPRATPVHDLSFEEVVHRGYDNEKIAYKKSAIKVAQFPKVINIAAYRTKYIFNDDTTNMILIKPEVHRFATRLGFEIFLQDHRVGILKHEIDKLMDESENIDYQDFLISRRVFSFKSQFMEGHDHRMHVFQYVYNGCYEYADIVNVSAANLSVAFCAMGLERATFANKSFRPIFKDLRLQFSEHIDRQVAGVKKI